MQKESKLRLSRNQRFRNELPLHLMLFPAVIVLLIYAYYPMIGLVIAFQRYNPRVGFFGSRWVGWDNFRFLMNIPSTRQVLFNTVFIATMKMVAYMVIPVFFAVLLDLIRSSKLKRSLQTVIYLPYFLSWVTLSGILIDLLSPSTGLVNDVIRFFGRDPVFFLADKTLFPYLLVITDIWKNAGYGTIIYLAAISDIDPELYEAARIDGGNRWQQAIHITLPGMTGIIVTLMTLNLGNVLNAGFEQVLNLYSPIVYETGDIIDTFVYRIGLVNNQYGIATAAGLFRSVISLIFIVTGYRLARKLTGYRIF